MKESDTKKPIRVAFLGGRGIPPTYGGYCTLFDQVATQLADDPEFEITVYCRKEYFSERPKWYKGIRLHYLPVWRNKYFESLLFTGMSVFHALLLRRFDVIFVVDNANGPLMLPFWCVRKPTALHTDGLGWKRRKWGKYGSIYYKWTEKVSARLTSILVSDAIAIQDYYLENYQAPSVFIPYGANVGDAPDHSSLKQYNLTPGEYFLIVTRIEPDNNTDILIREYKAANLKRPLIIVGGARYPSDFSRAIEAEANEQVRFLGGIYDSSVLNSIYANAFAYLHGHVVGGTNPALLRAMNAGVSCAAFDISFTREVIGEQGVFFSEAEGDLAKKLEQLEADPEHTKARGVALGKRANEVYRWDAVADAYATLFRQLANKEHCTEAYQPENFYSAET